MVRNNFKSAMLASNSGNQRVRSSKSSVYTTTENGALTYKSTGTKVLDFYSRVGSMHTQPIVAEKLFDEAYSENESLAVLTLFWLRDILQGSGQMYLFRRLFARLVIKNRKLAIDLLPLIPAYGRWDDVLALCDTSIKDQAYALYAKTLIADAKEANGKNIGKARISLASKWAGTEGSGKTSRKYARLLRAALAKELHTLFTSQDYRNLITFLRSHLDLVETKLVNKDLASIDYKKLPSKAIHKYGKSKVRKGKNSTQPGVFRRRDYQRYSTFLADQRKKVERGEKLDIKANTLMPYEIVVNLRKLQGSTRSNCVLRSNNLQYRATDPLAELQWEALPNYFPEPINAVFIADTSGSMSDMVATNVTAMDVAISVALYGATKNKSDAWKDMVITFSHSPEVVDLSKYSNIAQKLCAIYNTDTGNDTNLQAVFDLILARAKKYKLSNADMPKYIVIASDLQFNNLVGISTTNHKAIIKAYKDAGYTAPNIIYWRIGGTVQESPVQFNANGVGLVSGFSATNYATLFEAKVIQPVQVMLDKLLSERYQPIQQVLNKYT